jgi:hypothetical protein
LSSLLVASLALSLIFAFNFFQIVAILFGGYFIFVALQKIRGDMDLNIKISPWKSLQAGKTYLLIGMSLIISMQYFVIINNSAVEKKVPHFDASFITKKIAIPFLSTINPQFKALKDETLTVDQFILQAQDGLIQGDEMSSQNVEILEANIPNNLTPAQREALKKQAMSNFSGVQAQLLQKNQELIISSGRKQFSDLAGITLKGDEKISEVFTGLVSNKIDNYFNPKVSGEEKSSVFSMLLAGVLFLTIYPLGSILSVAWFLIAKLLIFILLKLKVLNVKIVTVSKEILE